MDRERIEVYLEVLACPVCKGELTHFQRGDLEGFACRKCSLVYPIVDEIPNMLPEEALPLRDESSEDS